MQCTKHSAKTAVDANHDNLPKIVLELIAEVIVMLIVCSYLGRCTYTGPAPVYAKEITHEDSVQSD